MVSLSLMQSGRFAVALLSLLYISLIVYVDWRRALAGSDGRTKHWLSLGQKPHWSPFQLYLTGEEVQVPWMQR